MAPLTLWLHGAEIFSLSLSRSVETFKPGLSSCALTCQSVCVCVCVCVEVSCVCNEACTVKFELSEGKIKIPLRRTIQL